ASSAPSTCCTRPSGTSRPTWRSGWPSPASPSRRCGETASISCSGPQVVDRVAPCPTWPMMDAPMYEGYVVVVPATDVVLFEDRQRVDRWLEESQYLLGRLIPGYLEDRERLKARLAGSEADCQRLRLEVDGLRREVSGLLAELQHQRNEQAATAETFATVLGQ